MGALISPKLPRAAGRTSDERYRNMLMIVEFHHKLKPNTKRYMVYHIYVIRFSNLQFTPVNPPGTVLTQFYVKYVYNYQVQISLVIVTKKAH